MSTVCSVHSLLSIHNVYYAQCVLHDTQCVLYYTHCAHCDLQCTVVWSIVCRWNKTPPLPPQEEIHTCKVLHRGAFFPGKKIVPGKIVPASLNGQDTRAAAKRRNQHLLSFTWGGSIFSRTYKLKKNHYHHEIRWYISLFQPDIKAQIRLQQIPICNVFGTLCWSYPLRHCVLYNGTCWQPRACHLIFLHSQHTAPASFATLFGLLRQKLLSTVY